MYMVPISICALCSHRRAEKKDGWISTCDAFVDGKPRGFEDSLDINNDKVCNNTIGFDLNPAMEKFYNKLFKHS